MKMLYTKQILQRLSIQLVQVKAGNEYNKCNEYKACTEFNTGITQKEY